MCVENCLRHGKLYQNCVAVCSTPTIPHADSTPLQQSPRGAPTVETPAANAPARPVAAQPATQGSAPANGLPDWLPTLISPSPSPSTASPRHVDYRCVYA